MAMKRTRRRPPRRPQASMTTRRYSPPYFEAHDPHELRVEAERIADREGLEVGHAMWVALHKLERRQVEQLLKSLGCDPSTPDWESAFFKLARHCCNVGQIRRARGGSSGTNKKWTFEHEFILLMEVHRLTRDGSSERAAIKQISKDRAYDQVFPYEERVDGIRVKSRRRVKDDNIRLREVSRQRREEAIRRRFESIKQRGKNDPKRLELALGLTIPDSVIPILTLLDLFPKPSK
jgi:hypothetical protein